MNRRQEVAAWIIVVLMAGPRFLSALDSFDSVEEMLLPLLIVAPMLIYSLRSRPKPPLSPSEARRGASVTVGALLLAGAACLAAERLEGLGSALADVSSEVEDLQASTEQLSGELQDLRSDVNR